MSAMSGRSTKRWRIMTATVMRTAARISRPAGVSAAPSCHVRESSHRIHTASATIAALRAMTPPTPPASQPR